MLDVSISIREDQVSRIIAEQKPKKIGIQAPDGLLNVVLDFAERLEQQHGVETMILFDPSYGTCDLDEPRCQAVGLGPDSESRPLGGSRQNWQVHLPGGRGVCRRLQASTGLGVEPIQGCLLEGGCCDDKQS